MPPRLEQDIRNHALSRKTPSNPALEALERGGQLRLIVGRSLSPSPEDLIARPNGRRKLLLEHFLDLKLAAANETRARDLLNEDLGELKREGERWLGRTEEVEDGRNRGGEVFGGEAEGDGGELRSRKETPSFSGCA